MKLKDLEKKLAKYRGRYTLLTNAAYAKHSTKNCILFALLSVNTSYKINAKAFEAMKDADWTDHTSTMNELMHHGVHYASARASYINEAYEKLNQDPKRFNWFKFESINEYRLRLVKDIKGLSWIKVSFFISLKYGPRADICCLDRWVLRALGSKTPDKTMRTISKPIPLHKARYEKLEGKLRAGSNRLNMPLCAYQWGIWDLIQSENNLKSNPMKILWGKKGENHVY